MTKIYIVRHCEAAGNQKRLFQGSTDCDITELGALQLEFLKKRFERIPIDSIYTSPLLRARKTAEAIRAGRDLSITKLQGFAEIHGGIVEGKPFFETFKKIPELAEIWNNHPEDFAPEGGEPMREAYERIWDTVLSVANDNKGKTVAIASHGGVIRCLNCRLLYGTINRLKDTSWSENTAVSLITFDDEMRATLNYMNDHSHVPDKFLPKRSRIVEVAEV